MIIFEWYKYLSYVKKRGQGRLHYYRLPYIDDGTEGVPETVRNHIVCTWGLQLIMSYGRTSFGRIVKAATYSSVLPRHKSTGKSNYNSIESDHQRLEPLVRHLEYLKSLGEVQATRVVSTLVDRMVNHCNCKDETTSRNVTYLPISMGYRQCYRRYMALLGYRAETTNTGAFNISRDDGGDINNGEFVSYTTYYYKWRRDYPNLKVSRPVEDICNLCYTLRIATSSLQITQ
jgi:hypothetical protein